MHRTAVRARGQVRAAINCTSYLLTPTLHRPDPAQIGNFYIVPGQNFLQVETGIAFCGGSFDNLVDNLVSQTAAMEEMTLLNYVFYWDGIEIIPIILG